MKKWSLLILGTLMVFPLALQADTIKIKKTGATFNGHVIYESPTEIWLDIGTGKIVFKRKEVIRYKNALGPKKRPQRVSFVEYGGGTDKKENKKSGDSKKGTSKSSSGNKSSGKSSSAPTEKPERVPADTLSDIQMHIRGLQRTRATYRTRALRYLTSTAPKYPQTVSSMILKVLNHDFARVRMMAAQILGETGRDKNIEKLMALLKDKDKWVRYQAAEALKTLSKQSIDYPKPNKSLDNSITSAEQDAVLQWEKWYSKYEAKKFKEEIRRQQKEKKADSGSSDGQDTKELLNKLKKLLEQQKNNK